MQPERQLRALAELCIDMGVTPIFCHHTKKSAFKEYGPLGLADLHGAGTGEFARQFWLLNRREQYRDDGHHKLWLRAGASYGHGGLWGVDVDEGVWDGQGSRHWRVDVLTSEKANRVDHGHQDEKREAGREARGQARLERDKRRVVDVLVKYPDGESKTVLRDRANLPTRRFQAALASLLDDRGEIASDVFKSNWNNPISGAPVVGRGPQWPPIGALTPWSRAGGDCAEE